jgi:hypothetical protein
LLGIGSRISGDFQFTFAADNFFTYATHVIENQSSGLWMGEI